MNAKQRVAMAILALFPSISAHAVKIEMVWVGNPGNAPDNRWCCNFSAGSVARIYQIGKYEVTAGQYTEFLNAVAKADPNGLYSTTVDPSGPNIQRSGSSPYYSYSVAADWADRPVNYVSFWDAARFANWLHNGQPTGPQGPGTTEDGAYHNVGDQDLFGRNPGAKFFLPTQDEWYKAAYHVKSAGLRARYSTYATGAFSAPPGNDIHETTTPGNNANYLTHPNPPIGAPYYRTNVGEFELSDSFYGTFDQTGNVSEWVDNLFGPYSFDPNSRIALGSNYRTPLLGLAPEFGGDGGFPTVERALIGFRVAGVPEPSTLYLAAMASMGLLLRRKR